MRYGIVTFHNAPNYGAALQAYGLCKCLNKIGFNSEIIDYRSNCIEDRERVFKKTGNVFYDLKEYCFSWKNQKKKIKKHDSFMLESNILSKESYNKTTITKANSQYDCFITGSDQVWNSRITCGDLTYFLDFANSNKKLVAFAPSVEIKWNKTDENLFLPYLLRYSSLSCRERNTCDYIESISKKKCEFVCDPTMLLKPSEYRKISIVPKEKNYVLVYYPNKALLDAAKTYAKRKNLQILVIANGRKESDIKKISPGGPSEWLGYIEYADAIFTNSFHGFLFSLYFNKKVSTTNRGDRLNSIIQFLNGENVFYDLTLSSTANYEIINQTIDSFRNQSIKYLNNSLKE